ncbi:hypothetical protein SAMN04488056_12338 [Cohaesibacter marisflavi]|uniref:Uncharacterized protein n=1 Tax=Cohaesibacter marisflavi TaxID=655353 RepID=A0A1I5MV11_9HYPH|nr:hypothetical protein [Cohaesibacter marisflavi]SFP13359.1 hypothetical protein SAMN04488056_12338 [Cohaesibacter marisflavi]
MSATPITQDDRDVSYVAVEAQTEFAVTYKFQVDSDLVVSIVAEDDSETVLTLNVDYTVSGAGEDTGGTVTLLEGAVEGTEYRIRGEAKLVLYQKLTSANYSRATINTIFERCLIWITETLSKINVVQTAFDYFNSTTVPAIEQIKKNVDESLAQIVTLEQSASDSADAVEAAFEDALLESETLSPSGLKTLVLPDNSTISPLGATLMAGISQAAMQTTLGVYSTTEVDAAIAGLVDSSPEALDTLNELAAALGNDENFASTVTDSIATKLTASQVNGAYDPPTWFVPDEFSAGGTYIDIVRDPTDTTPTKPFIWLEGKTTGNTSRSYPLGIAVVGEVTTGGTRAISGIRAAMTNTGTDNDCVGLSARTTNSSNGGMSCGVFGAGAVTTATAKGTMGVEGHIYVNSGETTAPRDGAGIGWRAAMHAYSDSLSSPAHHGLTIDSHGATAGYYGFWNGLTIDGNAFAHNGDGGGNAGTVGIQCGNWSSTANYPEIGWKVGYVGTYHIARGANEFKVNSNDFLNINPTGHSRFICRPLDTTFGGFRVEVDDGAGGYEGAAIFTWDGAATIVGNQRAEPIIFKTNDTERMRITAAGDIDTSGQITGDAVQSSATDTTSGALLTVGAGGLLSPINLDDGDDFDAVGFSGFFTNQSITAVPANSPDGDRRYTGINLDGSDNTGFQVVSNANGDFFGRTKIFGGSYADWAMFFSQSNIVGTVSKDGSGVPTGAIFEKGAGTGYIYYKYADGRLEYIRDDATFAYVASADLLTFTETMAVTFTSDPTMISVCLPSNSSNYTGVTLNNIGCQRGFVTGSALTAQLPRTFGSPDFESGDNITNCKLMVTGRWF